MNTPASEPIHKEYNVCLQGAALDVGNLGCCALVASFAKLIIDIKPNAKIYLLYGNRTGGVQTLKVGGRTVEINIINCRLSPRARLQEHLFWILFLALVQRIIPIKSVRDKIVRSNHWLRTLYYADFVGEIRGGDSFSDIYGLRRLLLGVIPSVIVILMRKNLTLLPQTYGPFRSRIAKGVARLIMTRSTKLFSRDKDSVEVVQELLRHKGRNKKTGFCPDIAFVMESTTPREMAIHPPLTPHNSAPLIGLNISSLLYFFRERTHGNRFGLKIKYDEFNQALLKQLMEQTEANVLLIPHVFWGGNEPNELDICNSIYAQMNRFSDRIHLVTRQYDQSEMKGIIGMCDFLIGARMHACIAALSQCIPTIGLAYSRKFHGVFQSVQAEQMVVDMREKNQDEALDLIFDALDRRESLAKSLERNIPKIQSQIWDNFKDLLCKTEN